MERIKKYHRGFLLEIGGRESNSWNHWRERDKEGREIVCSSLQCYMTSSEQPRSDLAVYLQAYPVSWFPTLPAIFESSMSVQRRRCVRANCQGCGIWGSGSRHSATGFLHFPTFSILNLNMLMRNEISLKYFVYSPDTSWIVSRSEEIGSRIQYLKPVLSTSALGRKKPHTPETDCINEIWHQGPG